jgi:hypothetical protein
MLFGENWQETAQANISEEMCVTLTSTSMVIQGGCRAAFNIA